MATTQELVEALADRFPDDAEDLRDALEVFQKQRLSSCERLAKLSDSQWQRLGVPMGIETILRDALDSMNSDAQAAPPQPERPAPTRLQAAPKQLPRQNEDELPLEAFEEESIEPAPEGLRRRGGSASKGGSGNQQFGGSGGSSRARAPRAQPAEGERKGLLSAIDLTPPPDLEPLWQQLLEDTLPPDKRAALQESWEQAGDDHDRYMMFLEYSSYLRKPEVTEQEKEERRKQLEPLMKEFGIRSEMDESSWSGMLIWFLFVAVILFVAGLLYYMNMTDDPVHDSQAL